MITSNKQLKHVTIDALRAATPAVPRCPHAAECGGCAAQDRAYEGQVAAKRAVLRRLWDELLPPEQLDTLTVMPSPSPYGYRTRMDYVAAKGRFGLRRSGKFNYIIDLHECHLIPPEAFASARAVYERAVALGLPDYNLKTHEGFLRYIVVRCSPQGQVMLALVAASRAHADAMADLAELALAHAQVISFHWLLNDKLTDISFGESIQHWGQATLPMQVGPHTLQIGPNTFFQNNIHLLLPLLDDVKSRVRGQGSGARVADLYGGVGTIALHIAGPAAQVICVESVAESAALAAANARANGLSNIAVVAADTATFLRDQSPGSFDVVVADPPRTGLGPEVCRELLRLGARRLVYVSCNPLTQVDDARALLMGYHLTELRGYDMFPHTPHLESLAVFDRRS